MHSEDVTRRENRNNGDSRGKIDRDDLPISDAPSSSVQVRSSFASTMDSAQVATSEGHDFVDTDATATAATDDDDGGSGGNDVGYDSGADDDEASDDANGEEATKDAETIGPIALADGIEDQSAKDEEENGTDSSPMLASPIIQRVQTTTVPTSTKKTGPTRKRRSGVNHEVRLARKREREKQRRDEFSQTFVLLLSTLLKVDPGFRAENHMREQRKAESVSSATSASGSAAASRTDDGRESTRPAKKRKAAEDDSDNFVFSRTELVTRATETLQALSTRCALLENTLAGIERVFADPSLLRGFVGGEAPAASNVEAVQQQRQQITTTLPLERLLLSMTPTPTTVQAPTTAPSIAHSGLASQMTSREAQRILSAFGNTGNTTGAGSYRNRSESLRVPAPNAIDVAIATSMAAQTRIPSAAVSVISMGSAFSHQSFHSLCFTKQAATPLIRTLTTHCPRRNDLP